MTIRIGFDIDGVLCSDLKVNVWDNDTKRHLDWYRRVAVPLVPTRLLDAGWEWLLVTGRPVQDLDITFDWFALHYAKQSALLFTREFSQANDFEAIAEFKAEVINTEGVRVFVESDTLLAEAIASKVTTAAQVWTVDTFLERGYSELRKVALSIQV